ncbi:MAG: hypothetical protein JST06_10825 [Bacteroidetes bacterium]|nr:hypothetical protein [Bacteroidota bacterium]MBS1629982.1 hypothetical protein [Bacteroidota bacterium]
MQVFIVRPFGIKNVLHKKPDGQDEIQPFDFDAVEEKLIQPALKALSLSGGTTGKIFTAGEIREDMFSELLLADIVIADITVHNANVFYELGIRNALRNKTTVLINCPGFDMTPFDIIGYRYVSYDKEQPEAAIERLKDALRESISSNKSDSPVFNMLPTLEVPDTERFFAVPPDFSEEAARAFAAQDEGWLTLLSKEAARFEWRGPAMRLLGRYLYRLNAFRPAQWAWETLLAQKSTDFEANEVLATIYQRLAERDIQRNSAQAAQLLQLSDKAIENLLTAGDMNRMERAQAFALKGRNAKTRWAAEWAGASDAERISIALSSPYWENSLAYYADGFRTHLNHYYSGINLLGLLTGIVSMAEAQPDIWLLRFDETTAAETRLAELKKDKEKLTEALHYTIESERARLKALGEYDPWLDITYADFFALTADNVAKVSFAYNRIIRLCDQMQTNAIIRQLLLFRSLGIMPDNMNAALKVTGEVPNEELDNHYLLFTGHMIDQPCRTTARFPPDKEVAARQAIEAQIRQVIAQEPGREIRGIAGGACGGDILFHEVCEELGIKTELFLSLPREAYISESVAFAGNNWLDRFDALYTTLPHRVLAPSKALPLWLQKKAPYDFWSRSNLWMLYNALTNDSINMSLLALWDGQGGDGEGGTAHMVELVRKQGGIALRIDIQTLSAG